MYKTKPSNLVTLCFCGIRERRSLAHIRSGTTYGYAPLGIIDMAGINSYHLETPDGESIPLPMNGQLLKEYYSKGT